MKDILCPTDLSETALKGIEYADMLAAGLNSSVSLLHVMNKAEGQGEARIAAQATMDQQVKHVKKAPFTCHFRDGEFMEEITRESSAGHAMMVCATHGSRGLRQSLFGTDILKLVRRVEIPSLVVQAQSCTPTSLGTIVMPVASHKEIDHLLDAVSMLASAFGSEVHIYQLIRPGEQPSVELLANKKHMGEYLTKAGVRHMIVEDDETSFSIGFAVQTIAYAERIGAGCIAIMSMASDEYRYIADAEKERMLTNEPGIPVLCAR